MDVKQAIVYLKEKGYEVMSTSELKKRDRLASLLLSYIQNSGNLSSVAKEFGLTRERARQLFLEKFNLKGTGFKDNSDKLEQVKQALAESNNCALEAARRLNMTPWYVSSLRKKYFPEMLPLQKKRESFISDEEFKVLHKDLEGNMSKIAKHLGVKTFMVYEKANQLKLRAKGHIKVPDATFIEVAKKNKGSATAIATELGLSLTAVYSRLRKIKEML